MRILVLGSEGMLGHVVKRYFELNNYETYSTSRNKNDINYFDAVENMNGIITIIDRIKPDVIINCIGILNKVAEGNKALAVFINSYLPHFLDSISVEKNFKFIHVSTDCVFDGKKGQYSVDSFRDAETFYGRSKALGEVCNDRNLTLRTSIVGPDENPRGIGLFQWFLSNEKKANGYTNVIWTGVTTIQFAKCMEEAIKNNLTGLHHAVNGEEISKYNLLKLFSKYFKPNVEIIEDNSYVSNKSLILNENNYKFSIPSYEDMVREMKDWVIQNKDIYPNINLMLESKEC